MCMIFIVLKQRFFCEFTASHKLASLAGWSGPAESRISVDTYNGRFQTNQVRKRPRNRRSRRWHPVFWV
uniref:Uncharacterized protein n=1 Tax=Pararge aegeria TaxID=116150 RepID=S4PRV5_9NEOP